MFSGIIQGCFPIIKVLRKRGLTTFTVNIGKLSKGLKKGNSVSVDGVCLTVAKLGGKTATFDAMKETLSKTTIGQVSEGRKVNIERSVRIGDEIGGHNVSGHVHGTAEIVNVEKPKNNWIVTFKCDKKWMKYIFPKGFIALDGASLTVVDVDKKEAIFTVYFIPETLKLTTFGFKKKGDRVNMEIDQQTHVIVDTLEAFLKEKIRQYQLSATGYSASKSTPQGESKYFLANSEALYTP